VREATEVSRRQGRCRRIDPLVFVLGITAAIVYALHGFDGSLSRDLAIYSYAGQQVFEGVPPYLGILNRAGPLAHLIPAVGVAGARVAGFEDLLGIRVLFMLIAVACVCVVYLLARDLFSSRLAGVAAAAAFLSFYGFIEYASNGPREKTPMVLFLLCAFLAIVNRRWFAAGISVSLTALIWQPAFLVGMAAVITTVIALRGTERFQASTRFIAGGLVPATFFIIYFAAAGALREFFDAFLLINAKYSEGDLLLPKIAEKWGTMQRGYGVSLWVLVGGLAALTILTLGGLRREGWRAPARIPVVAIGAASLVALAWTFRDFNSWPDAFVLLPLAAIGIGGISKALTKRLPDRAALAIVLAWVIAAVTVAVTYSTTQRNHELEDQRDAVDALLAQLPSDASIQAIGAPQPLVLSNSTNPTRHQTFVQGLGSYVDDTWPGGLAGFANWIGRQEPTVVSLGGGRVPRWLRSSIVAEYQRVGRAPGWVWYVHRSAASGVQIDSAKP
jgi:hypothetical protein